MEIKLAYIRVKRAKRKSGKICEYAYIVETRRVRKTKIKQKSKKYLGRVYRLERKNVMDFYEFHDVSDVELYVESKDRSEIVDDLLKLELFNYGFKEKDGIWSRDGCFLDLKKKKVYNEKGNKVALAFNDGYLTSYALARLLTFTADVEEEGYDFAKMFIEAGIAIPKDVFVGVFSKVMR